MKIVCESCGAKYSIADDRVVGKMFKIRCKKCSEVIVVRGDQQQAAAETEAAAPAPNQTAIWHVVVEGEQAGPYTPAQLAEMLTSGAVDWEAYVWAEGFDNWLPMRDVPDLVAQITGQPAQPAAAAPAPSNYRNQQQTLTGQPSMGADPFAEESSANDSGMFGAQPAAADLFARGPAQSASSAFSAGEDPGVVSSSPSPRLSAERVLTGARNENSVLFSLKNLQSLATGSSASTPSPAFGGGAAERTGFAGGEGSGLIDIRALANTTGMGDNADGHKDELLSIGTQGGAFGTLGSPMLAAAAEDGDGNKKLMIWASVAAIGFLSIAGVAVAYLLRGQNAPVAAAAVGVAPQAPTSAAAVAMPAQPATPAQGAAPAQAPSEGELAAAAAKRSEPAHESDSSGHGSSSGEHHKKHDSATSGKTATDELAAPAPEPKKAPPKGGPRSIDDLLDGALSGSSSAKSGKPEAAAAAASNLGETPTRDQVLSAMNGVKPAVQACAKGENGIATVTVNVAGASGHVTTAQVNGVTGPAGSCIAQAVRKAAFPKFKQNVFKITFPYKL